MCWQSFLTFAKDYPAMFTAGAFMVFWFLRFTIGHKMYWLTCWNKEPSREKWWRRFDLHDWVRQEVDVSEGSHAAEGRRKASLLYCSRCHLRKAVVYDIFESRFQRPRETRLL